MIDRPHPKADACCQRLSWQDLDLSALRALIAMAKDEDLRGIGLTDPPAAAGDPSSELLPAHQQAKAALVARQGLVVCGLHLAMELLQAYDPDIRFNPACEDGAFIEAGRSIATLAGPARSILSAERPLLNFLQKLSGVSTGTRRYVQALGSTPTRLLDTRKTTPGYRILEKYAVARGGGWNHRLGLYDRVMLKDNHLAAFGDNPREAAIAAVSASRRRHANLLVEMEVDRLDQIPIALAAQVDIVLLDNFAPEELAEAIATIDGRLVTEASGGITLESLDRIRDIGLDFISTGALVHQSQWIDIGLDWQ